MQAAPPPLEDFRAEIDRVDRAMVELLIERTEIVRRIGEIKADRRNGRLALRPGREARILRRLMDTAGERFPHDVLVRIWRELMAALTRLQTPHAVFVHAPDRGLATWDLARDQFGSLTPMHRVESAGQAVRAVGDDAAAVAVLPLPDDEDSWWSSLISDRHDRLRVFARLPFVTAAPAEVEEAQALAIGRVEPEPSEDDLTLLSIEADLSRARLRDLLAGAGLDPGWLAVRRPPGEGPALHLVEVAGFVPDGDDRLGRLRDAARREVLRIAPLGGYPRPLRAAPGP